MLPASILGKINTFAWPATFDSGAFLAATLSMKAASNWSSPSTAISGFLSAAILAASATIVTLSWEADPWVEKESIATFGSIPNCFAVSFDTTATSARPSASRSVLIAQSAIRYSSSSLIMMKAPEHLLYSGFVFMIWRAGLTVSAVVWAAPDTSPLAFSIYTSIVPK